MNTSLKEIIVNVLHTATDPNLASIESCERLADSIIELYYDTLDYTTITNQDEYTDQSDQINQ